MRAMSTTSWLRRSAWCASLAVVVAACAATGTTTSTTTGTTTDGELTGTIALTRQRDLLDRGLVNVFVDNRSADAVVLSDIALDADMFDAPPAADRSITVRPGREIAVQVPFGQASDCDTDRPVTARLRFGSAASTDEWTRGAELELAGTDVLDAIRAEQCASRTLAETVRPSIADVETADGSVTADLVLAHTGGPTIDVVGVAGTILVAAAAPADALGVRLAAGDTVSVPLTFRVNRCDPHAMAEVTKRFGVELRVSIDGAAPADVAVDVTAVEPELELLVERCRNTAVAQETAATTCGALRELDNRLVDLVNESVAGISSLLPADRRDAVLDGVERIESELVEWQQTVADLALPESVHTGELLGQMRAGVDDALAELAAAGEAFVSGPATVPDDEVQGLVGTWFNSVEKVMSVLEPDVSRLDDAVAEQAFLDEPTCRHVVQQYVVD